METVEQVLSTNVVFRSMTPDDLDWLAGCASRRSFEAGEYVLREGQPADTFYLLRSGQVALEIHEPGRGTFTIQTLGAGDILGWSWLFQPFRWHLDARTLTPLDTIAFDAICIREKCDDDSRLGNILMRHFAQAIVQRLQATRLQLVQSWPDDEG